MPSYTIRDINSKLWREFKSECAYRGISIREFFIDKIKGLAKDSKRLRKKEKGAGL